MSNLILPRGRGAVPKELRHFGIHLVYSEGKETEPNYIENIKKNISLKYRCKPNDINIIPVTDKLPHSTTRLVKYAKSDVKKRLKKGKQIDHVWIFFDKDEFDDFEEANIEINKINNSKNTNDDGFTYETKTGISWHSCPSNESFELWFCLYFSYYNVAHGRKDYIDYLESRPSLKKIGFKYEKNMVNVHDIFSDNGGSIKEAINHAKKLEKENGINNPSTGVYKFAEYFCGYMTDDSEK